MYYKGIKVDSKRQKDQVKSWMSKPKKKKKKSFLKEWHSYHEYLKSEVWHDIRIRKLNEVEHKCQICYSNKDLQVHHRTYKRIFKEKLSDLTVLCGECHQLFHNHLQQKKMTDEEVESEVIIMLKSEGYI